jgi:hypothetical protein
LHPSLLSLIGIRRYQPYPIPIVGNVRKKIAQTAFDGSGVVKPIRFRGLWMATRKAYFRSATLSLARIAV